MNDTPKKLVMPANCKDVTAEYAGTVFALIGADGLRRGGGYHLSGTENHSDLKGDQSQEK